MTLSAAVPPLVLAPRMRAAPTAKIGAPAPLGWPRSRPSDCCLLTAPLIAAAIWPSRLAAAPRSSFWNFRRPESVPPARLSGGINRLVPPSVIVSIALAGSKVSGTALIAFAFAPSTRLWPPPMNTPTLPSSASIVVTLMVAAIWPISESRWSSSWFGVWPPPFCAAICAFSCATCLASELTLPTATLMSCVTPVCKTLSRSPAARKRDASSVAWLSTTWRADESPGLFERSTKAFRNSPAA